MASNIRQIPSIQHRGGHAKYGTFRQGTGVGMIIFTSTKWEFRMAGRKRIPQEVAKITGAVAKNAGRFEGRSSPKVKSLGSAPNRFTPDQVEIWNEFNNDYPWLGRSDRRHVGLAVVLQSQIDIAGMDTTPPMFAQMRLLLSGMGGSPVDRSKVPVTADDETDPADEFLN